MHPNRFIDLLVNLSATLNVMGGEPAAHAPSLKIRVQPLRKQLVPRRIRYEARIVLYFGTSERRDISHELLGHSDSAQKDLWDFPTGLENRIDPDSRGPAVPHQFESVRFA